MAFFLFVCALYKLTYQSQVSRPVKRTEKGEVYPVLWLPPHLRLLTDPTTRFTDPHSDTNAVLLPTLQFD
ncbi:hypothetical protein PILCRDRAFT_814300 [Piloderma croceum F 1598]|uniref:Secreted protein n=1 Tax=Piloderma croceum (strain F 1598) TaxID=765440 RepID=A0A0C3GCN0_PILCF|nr:hypothetical protein PILCRDRAFT_814300 [Piloderma croceum F 1598]